MTSSLPPVQPKTTQTRTIATIWFQAVVISCWAVEPLLRRLGLPLGFLLLEPLAVVLLLRLGGLRLGLRIGLGDEQLAARPAEDDADEDDRDDLVPGGRDQLLGGRGVELMCYHNARCAA